MHLLSCRFFMQKQEKFPCQFIEIFLISHNLRRERLLERLKSDLNLQSVHTISQSKPCHFSNGHNSMLSELIAVLQSKLCLGSIFFWYKPVLNHQIRQKHLSPQNWWVSTYPYTLLVMSSEKQQADISFRKSFLERPVTKADRICRQSEHRPQTVFVTLRNVTLSNKSPTAVTVKHCCFILLRCAGILLHLISHLIFFHSLISCL